MTVDDTTMEQRPRITALPGDAKLVRISEASWTWVRAIALDQEPPAEITEEQIIELELVGLLVDAPGDDDGLVIDPNWQQFLRSALRLPRRHRAGVRRRRPGVDHPDPHRRSHHRDHRSVT